MAGESEFDSRQRRLDQLDRTSTGAASEEDRGSSEEEEGEIN
jgi:hypothetical protein